MNERTPRTLDEIARDARRATIRQLDTPTGWDATEAAILSALREARQPLLELVRECREALTKLDRFYNATIIHQLDIEGVQDSAVECGLLAGVEVTGPCSDVCPCADVGFPTECYRNTDVAHAAIARADSVLAEKEASK